MKVTITAEEIRQFHERDFGSTTIGSKPPSIATVFRVRLPARPTSLSHRISISCSTHPIYVENGSSTSIRAGHGATTSERPAPENSSVSCSLAACEPTSKKARFSGPFSGVVRKRGFEPLRSCDRPPLSWLVWSFGRRQSTNPFSRPQMRRGCVVAEIVRCAAGNGFSDPAMTRREAD
jgi:hypothetical protein